MFRRAIFLLALIISCCTAPSPTAFAQGDPQQGKTTIHVVQRGDTLYGIAQQYGTTVEAIIAANGITDVTTLAIGQRLLIPNATTGDPGVPTQYVIQPADTLLSLSLRFATTVDDLARRNNMLNPLMAYVGQAVTVQEGSTDAQRIGNGWLHTVTSRDTFFRVAAQYGVTTQAIFKANELTPSAILMVGQKLVIPGTGTAPALVDLPEPFSNFTLTPGYAEQGKTIMLRLTTEIPVTMTGTFMERPLVVITDLARTSHAVVFGIDSLAKAGVYPITLDATDADNQRYSITRFVEVRDGGYPYEDLILAPELGDLIDPAITQPELDRILQIVTKFTPQRYFAGPMGLPCSAAVTSQFGTRRSYNGSDYSFVHTGTDFAASPGSPIVAPAAGIVVLAEPLNVRGNAVIIDHGWGVYTGYWHQSEVYVKVGDHVDQGQTIGTVGSTGRVTGAHLHWELYIYGVSVDPLQWVRESFN
ncbi:MAG: LysM peptidoglycan-binding domain-containing protein [Anaerolineae bacterium]